MKRRYFIDELMNCAENSQSIKEIKVNVMKPFERYGSLRALADVPKKFSNVRDTSSEVLTALKYRMHSWQ